MSHSFIQQTIAEHLMCGRNYANTEEPEGQGKKSLPYKTSSLMQETDVLPKTHANKSKITMVTGDTKGNYMVL